MARSNANKSVSAWWSAELSSACLLYTSAAADAYTAPQDEQYPSETLNQALTRLANLGLIERMAAPETFEALPLLRVHRLIVSFVRLVNPNHEYASAVEEAVLREATRISDARLPGPMLAIQDHLRAVTTAACQREDGNAARLCAILGWHLTLLSAYTEARDYLQESILRFTRQYGETHAATAGSFNMLGLLHQWNGDLAAAQPCFEQALAIWETCLLYTSRCV